MELDTRNVISKKLRPDETLLWCGRPNPAIRFSVADAVSLIPILLSVLTFFWLANTAEPLTAVWVCAPIFFIILFASSRTFYLKLRDKKEVHYAITNERILTIRVKADGYMRDIQTKELGQITSAKMSFNREGIGTIVFLSGHSNHLYRNNPMAFYDIDDCEGVMDIYRKTNRDAEQEPAVSPKTRVLSLLIFFGFLALFIFLIFSFAAPIKTPPTAEQVRETLISFGYEPQDLTELYTEDSKAYIETCIGVLKGDMYIKFLALNDRKIAQKVSTNFSLDIDREKTEPSSIERKMRAGNCSIFALKTQTKYSVSACIATTVIYANCDPENSAELNEILSALNYLH